MSVGQDQEVVVDEKKLFIGGLSWETTEENLKAYFSRYGEVSEATIKRDRQTGKPRGFGFVTFKDAAPSSTLLQQTTHELDGKTIDPKPATERNVSNVGPSKTNLEQYPRKVFIGGIPPLGTAGFDTIDSLEAALKQLLQDLSRNQIEAFSLKTDFATNRHRGFAFATFKTAEVVKDICGPDGHKFYPLGSKQIEIKTAEVAGQKRTFTSPGYGYQQQWSGDGGYGSGSYHGYGTGSDYYQQYGMYPPHQGYNQQSYSSQQQQTTPHGNSAHAQMGGYYSSAPQGDSSANGYGQGYGSYGASYGTHQSSTHPGYQPQQHQPHQQQYYGHHPGR